LRQPTSIAKRTRTKPIGTIAILVGVLASTGLPHASDGGGLAEVQRRGTLRWGGDMQGGEPFVFRDPEDTARLIGFEVEIADALARRLGVRAEFVQNDWHNLVPSLERGDFDVILNGLEVTPSRRDRIALSRPYYAFTEVLVVRREDAAVRSLRDLRGRRVGTLGGSLAYELLRRNAEIELVLYEGVEEPYSDLEQGRIAGVLLDNIIADRYGLVRPTLRLAGTEGEGLYAVGVRLQDADLLRAIDAALADMMHAGELRAILQRWKLWDEQQGALAAALPDPESITPASASFTLGHFWLFVRAAGFTVVISSLAMMVAVTVGLLLSVMRRYGGRATAAAASVYIELFRGTPVLLQLYVLYYGLAPILRLDAFTAAVLGLGLNYAAYEAELYRAGLQAVPIGQSEAALSLGMSRSLTLRRIVLPQALRVALPGVANDFIALLKDSSLVSVITVVELTKQMTITAVDVRSWLLPGLLCALLYLALGYPLSRLARRLERRLVPVPA
jgi:polar amino acid transport system substrate-binding protein